MGREIRQVPIGWEHPKDWRGQLKPMYDYAYKATLDEWIGDYRKWEDGTHEDRVRLVGEGRDQAYWEWAGGPPDPDSYRPEWPADAVMGFCMYENVTEGTPCTPVFATLQELEDWLVEFGEKHGTEYNQKYSRSAAHAFCETGYAFSFMISPEHGVQNGIEAMGTLAGEHATT